MSNEYDVIVIGGGPAGYPAAIRAAQNKLKVACIDEWKNKDGAAVFGGTCTNAGCIPSKALLESSELYHKTKEELGVHGIKVSDVQFDIAQMQKRKTGIVKASTTGIAMLLKSAGVTALQGHGKLLPGRKVEFTAHDGKKETLLSVPHYDFKWQHLYRLAQPKRLPAGTRLVCRGAHDNSPQNPDNPDSGQTIGFGDQTFNEMFIGYFNYTDAPTSSSVAKSGGG